MLLNLCVNDRPNWNPKRTSTPRQGNPQLLVELGQLPVELVGLVLYLLYYALSLFG